MANTIWNPKWVAFLALRGMSPEQAETFERPARISLNAEFICATMKVARGVK